MQLEHKPDGPASAVPPAGLSLLDELREVYNAIDDDEVQTEVFDVEGSRAAVRYRRMGYEEAMAALSSDGKDWERNAQFLIEACDEILVRDADGALEPLVEGQRVTFDLRPGESIPLHHALGVAEDDIRRSVLRLFQGAEQVLMIHAGRVDAWMNQLRGRVGERFAKG